MKSKYLVDCILSRSARALLVVLLAAGPKANLIASPGFLCRTDFFDDDVTSSAALFRVVSDGPRIKCSPIPTDHPLVGGSWDYWSSRADDGIDPVCSGSGGDRNNVQRNNGQWMFSTGWTERWIRVNWKGALVSAGQTDPRISDPTAPNLDYVLYAANNGPAEKNPDPTVDHLVAGITVGNLFAPGVTRVSLTINIFEISASGTTGSWFLVYKQALYVTQDDPANPKLVCLSTVSPSGYPAPDVPQAELRHSVKPGRTVTIGTYNLPLTILVRKTDFPVQ